MTEYYTSPPRTDGFGAQFQNIIMDILYIYNNTNHRYVFPEIKSFEHNYTNDSDFIERLIRYMNLRSHFPLPSNVKSSDLKHYHPSITYKSVEDNLTRLLKSQTMKDIKAMFYANKPTPFDTKYYNVAVQIRRYNSVDTRVEGATTPHEYYIGLMNHIRATYPDAATRPLRFHIYSQTTATGPEAVFREKYSTGNNDTKLHLNGDVLPAFNGMVFADTLICSGSSLSYCAALLSNGVNFYKQFWHRPAEFWVVGDNILSGRKWA